MGIYNKAIVFPAAILLAAVLALGLAGCENPSGNTAAEETYRVSFNSQGGAPVAAQNVAKGGLVTKPADPVFAGHSLAGWYAEESYLSLWDFAAGTVNGDMTLYARWTDTELQEGEWELSFNSGGKIQSVTVKDGETAEKPGDPVWDSAHRFDGWFKDAACEKPWDFATDTVTANTMLYAKWTELNVTVHFEPNGGSPAPQDRSVARGGKLAAPVITRTGYVLDGWFLSLESGPAWDFDTDTVDADISLHAKWTEVEAGKVVLTFNADGGSPAPASQTVDSGGTITKPTDPTKDGFEFDGWFKEAALLNAWDFALDTAEEDMTLYARWTAVYTVTFNTGGGGSIDSITVRTGSKIPKPADPIRGADRFEGWQWSVTNTPWNFDTDTATGNVTLVARWTPVWTVSFDSKGGSAVAEIASVVDGSVIARPADPSKANNTFALWFKDAAYTSPWVFATDTVTDDTTLHAKWTAAVKFNLNGGTGAAPADQTVTSGLAVPAPETDPAREGWSFVGWCKEAAGLTLWNFATDTVVGNMTLYAKWEFVPVTGINTVPADGIVGEAVDLSAAAVEPPDASAQTILWTVSSAGTTGVAPASTGPFVPTATGTLKLTATVHNGKAGADGNPVDYTREFTITIIKIRKVTDISNVPTNGFVDIDVDLGGATVIPDNASKKTIVWSVKTAGAGITTISGHAFKPTSTGTVVLTATIANGNEDDSGTISDYTKDFAIRVDDPASVGGNVGFGEDTTIKLYSGATELIAGTVTTVAQDAVYRVSIDSGYTNVVWRLNGLQSTVTGNALILDTRKTGVIRLTVEAERSGAVDTGTYTFRIQ